MKKIFLIAGLIAALASVPLFAESAKVTYVKGKVEVQRNGAWVPLKTGDSVAQSETISTGFQSEARLNLNGSVLAVAALSRVTIETLKTSGSKDSVSLYVDTGAIRSKVTHAEGKKVNYTARTSVAVASVRGTEFSITARGNVNCTEGAVAVYPASMYDMVMMAANVQKTETAEAVEEAQSDAGEPAADEGPATANTAATDISENAPAGAVVVGAGQSTSFDVSGTPTKPFVEATKTAETAKSGGVATASDKEAVSTGSAATTEVPTATSTGTLTITVSIEG